MNDIIVLLILLVVCFFLVIRSLKLHIDVVQIGPRHYRVLLWYNSLTKVGVKRKWIELFKYEQKK